MIAFIPARRTIKYRGALIEDRWWGVDWSRINNNWWWRRKNNWSRSYKDRKRQAYA
jgi:hypothetical protein